MHVHKIDDIASLLRLQEEYGIRVTVEHACDVNDGRIYAVLRERGVPVVFGPLDAFAYKVELRHENWRNVRHLLQSGVDFGLMTDHPVIPQRNLLLELRWFIRCGLNRQDAIEIITRRNAQILGIDASGDPGEGEVGVVLLLERGPIRRDALPREGRRRGRRGVRGGRAVSRFTVVIADDRYAATTKRRRFCGGGRGSAGLPLRFGGGARRAFASADAILVNLFPMTAESSSPWRCRVISRYGVGYDNVDVEAATRKGSG